ncbi:DNA polymerase I [Desertibaculum subflavum]|uniref:DNA polymerase I n=1 Tax=Desertibaculum subflavum TaxID=2268458 RepID=UPI000E664C48
MAEAPHRKLTLVDGSGYIFRAYHALPPLTRKDGTPTGAVFGFCNMLERLVEDAAADHKITHLAVVFDAARETFRHQIYANYKANRPEPPEDLIPQFPLFRQAVDAFCVPRVELQGFEADDVIATYARLAKEAGIEVEIVSSDKDLMQLVRDGVGMYDPIKLKPIGAAEVMEKFGVPPSKVVEVQALAGDSTDNVPGVPGIGVKTAAQLINEYGDLDTLLARAAEIKQPKRRESLLANKEQALISRRLVQLDENVPVPLGLDKLAVQPCDTDRMIAFLREMEFERLVARAQSKLAGARSVPAPAASDEATAPAGPLNSAYRLVQKADELRGWVDRATRAGYVAVDTETTSLDAMQAKLVGVSLSVETGEACYIPLGHVGGGSQGALDLDGAAAQGAPEQIPMAEAVAILKPLLEDPAILKIGQNIKYDALVLSRLGIEVAPIDDTMLISFVLENGLHGHGMDELSELVLGHKPVSYDEVTGKGKTRITFDRVGLDDALRYAAEDADVTLRLHQSLKPKLRAKGMLSVYERLDRPLVPVVVAMERAGIKVDVEELRRLSAMFAKKMGELEAEIHELAGQPFNVGSPKQLGEILFDKMQLPGGRRMKTGAWGTDADVLEALAGDGHALPQKVLDWRQVQKLKSTYTDTLQQEINPETGRVHTSYALAATSTGRIASSDPNLQNIPVRTDEGRQIRRAFVAEPGNLLMSADYSQIELRILAHIADIEPLKQAFRDGIDIHAKTASEVFNVPVEGMDPMVRRSAKAINFGIIYGMSSFGLARQLGIGQREAATYIDAYFKRYPGIRDYMDRTKRQAREQGYVETIRGRRCHFPAINDKNPARRGFMERAAINAPIQGSAADIIKRAMVKLPAALARAGLKAKMLLQVHDELVFEVPEAERDATAATVRHEMEAAATLSVPLVVETGFGRNWGEAH